MILTEAPSDQHRGPDEREGGYESQQVMHSASRALSGRNAIGSARRLAQTRVRGEQALEAETRAHDADEDRRPPIASAITPGRECDKERAGHKEIGRPGSAC